MLHGSAVVGSHAYSDHPANSFLTLLYPLLHSQAQPVVHTECSCGIVLLTQGTRQCESSNFEQAVS
jgi:hypothetical protein